MVAAPPARTWVERVDREDRVLLGVDPPSNDCALAPSPSWSEERARFEEDTLDADLREIAADLERGAAGAARRLRATRSLLAMRAFTRDDRRGAWAGWEALLAEEPSDVGPLLTRALYFSCADDLDAALADLNRAVALAPRDPEVFLRRVSCFIRRGEWTRALADSRRLVHLCPRDRDALVSLAKCLRFTGDEAAAIRVLGRAIKLAPWRADLFTLRAACWGRLDKRREQRLDLDRCLALVPRDVEALRERARHFSATKDEDRQLADLSLAIEIEPAHVDTLKDRAALHERRGEAALALADLARVLALAPDDDVARRRRAKLHLAAGALAEVIADLDVVIPREEREREADPERRWRRYRHRRRRDDWDDEGWADAVAAEPYWWRGHAHRRLGDRDRARADYRAALALDPDGRADLERDEEHARIMKRPAERLDLLDALVLIAPDEVNYLVARAEVLRDAGRNQEALADLDRAIPLHSYPCEEHALRASVRWSLHDPEGALADLDRALTLGPYVAAHYSDRGYYRVLHAGPSAEAEADVRRAVELEPREFRPALYLACYLERAERWQEVIPVLDEMIRRVPEMGSLHARRAAARLHTGRGLGVLRAALADYDAALLHGADEGKTRPLRDGVAARIAKAEARAKRAREKRAKRRAGLGGDDEARGGRGQGG